MSFSPPRAVGLLFGMGILAVLLILDAVCIVALGYLPVNALTFALVLFPLASIPVIGLTVYRLIGLATARYRLDRNGLRLEWGLSLEVVPVAQIQAVRPASQANADLLPRGFWWPGCVVGRADVRGVGPVDFFAASGPSGMVLVQAGGKHFAISPADPDAFLQAFRDEDRMGALESWAPVSRRPQLAAAVWGDPWARALIAVGLVLGLGLLGTLTATFPDLPAGAPLHFDTAGRVDRMGPPSRLFILPIIGGSAWAANLLLGALMFPRERLASYWVWGSSVVVQLLVWVAAVQLLTG